MSVQPVNAKNENKKLVCSALIGAAAAGIPAGTASRWCIKNFTPKLSHDTFICTARDLGSALSERSLINKFSEFSKASEKEIAATGNRTAAVIGSAAAAFGALAGLYVYLKNEEIQDLQKRIEEERKVY